MCDRRIDADYEIEGLDESRRVGKVMQVVGEILQLHAARWTGSLSRRRTFLQRDEADAGYVAKRRQSVESDRAAAIEENLSRVVRTPASPAESDPQTGKTGNPGHVLQRHYWLFGI